MIEEVLLVGSWNGQLSAQHVNNQAELVGLEVVNLLNGAALFELLEAKASHLVDNF